MRYEGRQLKPVMSRRYRPVADRNGTVCSGEAVPSKNWQPWLPIQVVNLHQRLNLNASPD